MIYCLESALSELRAECKTLIQGVFNVYLLNNKKIGAYLYYQTVKSIVMHGLLNPFLPNVAIWQRFKLCGHRLYQTTILMIASMECHLGDLWDTLLPDLAN